MAVTQISTGITIINSLLGFNGVSITNQSTSASTAIATGSKVEVAGAFFTFGSDETPTASTWTAITTGQNAYIALTPSGTAGSQILSVSWVGTALAVWSDSKQGYYTSASSNIRVIASAYKTSATQYDNKRVLTGKIENILPDDFITNTKLANMAASTIKGQIAGGSGDPVDLTAFQTWNIFNAGLCKTFSATNPTSNDVYDALSASIPNVNDKMPMWGSAVNKNGTSFTTIINFHYAERTTSSIVRMRYTLLQAADPPNDNVNVNWFEFTDGSSTALGRSWELFWYGV